MKIDILTLFPEMFAPFEHSIIKRAKDKNLVEINLVNIRDFATDKHKTVDDRPYSGGPGMILRVDILDRAINHVKSQISNPKSQPKVLLLDARGKTFNQGMALELSHEEHLILICGHYEGVDHRVIEHLCDEVISVGDYVLSGGEIPAMTVVDTVVRLIPGALGNAESLTEESFNNDEVEYPQYTRPAEYKEWKVPEVLLSGDPKEDQEMEEISMISWEERVDDYQQKLRSTGNQILTENDGKKLIYIGVQLFFDQNDARDILEATKKSLDNDIHLKLYWQNYKSLHLTIQASKIENDDFDVPSSLIDDIKDLASKIKNIESNFEYPITGQSGIIGILTNTVTVYQIREQFTDIWIKNNLLPQVDKSLWNFPYTFLARFSSNLLESDIEKLIALERLRTNIRLNELRLCISDKFITPETTIELVSIKL